MSSGHETHSTAPSHRVFLFFSSSSSSSYCSPMLCVDVESEEKIRSFVFIWSNRIETKRSERERKRKDLFLLDRNQWLIRYLRDWWKKKRCLYSWWASLIFSRVCPLINRSIDRSTTKWLERREDTKWKERWHHRKGRKSIFFFVKKGIKTTRNKKKNKKKKLFNANYVEQTLQQLSTDIHQLHRMRRSNNYLFQYPIIIINIRSREGTTRDKFDDECVCILLKMIDEKTKRANEITKTNSSQHSRRWTIRLLLSSIRMIS